MYEWAGQERVAPVGEFMVKTGPDVVHYPVGDPAAPQVPYRYYPAGPALSEAAEELAEAWSELNVVHSFREGNTRSQFVFFSQLAGQAGWRLEPAGFAPGTPGRDEFVAARFFSQATGSNEHLVRVLAREITPS